MFKDEKREEQVSSIFDIMMNKVFRISIMLEVDGECTEEQTEELTKKVLETLLADDTYEGLDEYCVKHIPLATENGTVNWIFNSLSMYRETITESYKESLEPKVEKEPVTDRYITGDGFGAVFGADCFIEYFPEIETTGVLLMPISDRMYVTEDGINPVNSSNFFSSDEMQYLTKVQGEQNV
jgi:hypothetical protein